MKKILITGANGFLGQHLCFFLQHNYKIIATGKGAKRLPENILVEYFDTDLTDKKAVEYLTSKVNPDIIIHTAAMSKPDECEFNKPACLAANVDATKHLLCNQGVHFIYISTDFVFGENGPHAEDDATGPLNFYGESKLLAENEVKKSSALYTIIRPVFIYGKTWAGMRGSFIQWVKTNLEEGNQIKVVSDQKRTPTYVMDICAVTKTIIDRSVYGTYHIAGNEILSPYEMALETAKALQLDSDLIKNVTSETFPEPVLRAKKSGLKISKAELELDFHPTSFSKGVHLSFKEI